MSLALLLNNYLHDNWPREYGSVWNAVDAFRTGENIAPIVVELRIWFASSPTEEDARRLLLGAGYWPPIDGYSCVGWFQALERHLSP